MSEHRRTAGVLFGGGYGRIKRLGRRQRIMRKVIAEILYVAPEVLVGGGVAMAVYTGGPRDGEEWETE